MFQKNVGTLDRDIRMALGVFFFILAGFMLKGVLAIVALVLAGAMFLTALTSSCALYKLFGINTNRAEETVRR